MVTHRLSVASKCASIGKCNFPRVIRLTTLRLAGKLRCRERIITTEVQADGFSARHPLPVAGGRHIPGTGIFRYRTLIFQHINPMVYPLPAIAGCFMAAIDTEGVAAG